MDEPVPPSEVHRATLALARQHVHEATARVARQQALVERLRRQAIDTTMAESLLQSMTDLLGVFREHLEMLSGEHAPPTFQWIHERPDPLIEQR